MSFTKGPWKVVALDWSEEGNARFEIEGITRTGKADVNLIAAAPELYEALKEVVAISDRKHDAWDKAHAAIKKAEGR
jgi:hypothetical protein